MITGLILCALFLITVIAGTTIYNALITRKNDVDNMMGSIDAILKKRYDLIPNLVTVVQQYSTFEKSLLEKLTQLRSNALRPNQDIEEKAELSAQITTSMRAFALTVENYPNLKANESFLHLQRSIAILEEELSAARRVYNQAVTQYNNAREMFPSNLIAQLMHLESKTVFSSSQDEKASINLKEVFVS